MTKHKQYSLLFIGLILLTFSGCKSSAPKRDYKTLVNAAKRLGVEIDLKDDPVLYVEASTWIGTPYRSGGNNRRGVDCSGFTRQLYNSVYRKKLTRTTGGQQQQARRVAKRNLREGDLLFFSSNRSGRKVAHVGIYLKDDLFIHASTSRGVIVSNLKSKYYRQHWLHGGRI